MKTLEDIALLLMTGRIQSADFEGWEYRKGKTIDDIHNAVKKGMNPKHSFSKTEYEIDFIALYLKDVLKKKRISKTSKKGENDMFTIKCYHEKDGTVEVTEYENQPITKENFDHVHTMLISNFGFDIVSVHQGDKTLTDEEVNAIIKENPDKSFLTGSQGTGYEGAFQEHLDKKQLN